MKEKVSLFIAIIITVFFATCSNEEVLQETNQEINREAEQTLSLTASMPGSPTTRVDLIQDEDDAIILKWVEGDELQLAFVQEEVERKVTVTVKNISENGKKAEFEIDLPEGIDAGAAYNLFGVYGGGGLSDDNPTDVVSATSTGGATSLNGSESSSVQNRKDVMLYFESKNIVPNNPQISVLFKHLGSIFSVNLKNISDIESLDLQEIQLATHDTNEQWAYNASEGDNIYDLLSGQFQETAFEGNYISFKSGVDNLAPGDYITFWGWNPIMPDSEWPVLDLILKKDDTLKKSVNSKPAKTPTSGKAYYFYATWDGSNLSFTDESFEPVEDFIKITTNQSDDDFNGLYKDAIVPFTGTIETPTEVSSLTYKLVARDGTIIQNEQNLTLTDNEFTDTFNAHPTLGSIVLSASTPNGEVDEVTLNVHVGYKQYHILSSLAGYSNWNTSSQPGPIFSAEKGAIFDFCSAKDNSEFMDFAFSTWNGDKDIKMLRLDTGAKLRTPGECSPNDWTDGAERDWPVVNLYDLSVCNTITYEGFAESTIVDIEDAVLPNSNSRINIASDFATDPKNQDVGIYETNIEGEKKRVIITFDKTESVYDEGSNQKIIFSTFWFYARVQL